MFTRPALAREPLPSLSTLAGGGGADLGAALWAIWGLDAETLETDMIQALLQNTIEFGILPTSSGKSTLHEPFVAGIAYPIVTKCRWIELICFRRQSLCRPAAFRSRSMARREA